jgi:hypothetical protein
MIALEIEMLTHWFKKQIASIFAAMFLHINRKSENKFHVNRESIVLSVVAKAGPMKWDEHERVEEHLYVLPCYST